MEAEVDRPAKIGSVYSRIYGDICDVELVGLAKNGDAGAFGELVRRHRPMCLQRASALLRNRADAEDEVQNAILRAYLHIGGFEQRASFSTWLVSIVLNRCLMALRRSRIVIMSSFEEQKRISPTETFQIQVSSGDPTPEEILHFKQLVQTIQRKTANLPPTFRTALAGSQKAPEPSTATVGAISMSAAKSRLHRARRELKTRVEGQFRTRYSSSVLHLT
jgi:RNA polymerase sigma-70 factor, ECF subfamily